MSVELTVPEVGESISEVVIGDWLKAEGDQVAEDESVAELESDKATVELPAPVAGKIVKLLKSKGESAGVGEVIAVIEESDGGEKQPEKEEDSSKKQQSSKGKEEKDKIEKAGKEKKEQQKEESEAGGNGARPSKKERKQDESAAQDEDKTKSGDSDRPDGKEDDGGVVVMPAAARELAERGLKASDVEATGPGNRLLKEDVLRHKPETDGGEDDAGEQQEPAEISRGEVPENKPIGSRAEEVVAMTPMRKTIAERLVTSQQEGALLTTFNEVDMSRVVELRNRYKETFKERYGIKLGFMSFFIKASVEALKQFPQVNAEIRGTDIVYKNYFDISIAVSGGKGLVVPVIRNAERRSFAEIELIVDDFARRAQKNRIDLDELKGGTFTISNGGVFGSLMSTPIINPPQVAVLGLHAIQDRPVVIDGEIVVRPMMYVALTYDHRIIDGRESVTFLKRIKETIEDPGRMLLEI